MLECNVTDYEAMLGNIDTTAISSASCMSQCTGCKCNCQCSCRVSEVDSEIVWEVA